jgi:hypothetical protein
MKNRWRVALFSSGVPDSFAMATAKLGAGRIETQLGICPQTGNLVPQTLAEITVQCWKRPFNPLLKHLDSMRQKRC